MCDSSCNHWNETKVFKYMEGFRGNNFLETFENSDPSLSECLHLCIVDEKGYDPDVCLRDCGKWAQERQKKLETCYFRPGGLTPGDCETRCQEYYKIVSPNDPICSKSCKTTCNSCNSSQCKWTHFQSEEEFPYQLSIFGVAGNKKATISWEKPPYSVKKYIIMYFEEDKQHESGVNFIEMKESQCGTGKYCSRVIRELNNDKNYIIGVSLIFQNNSITRMSNRLVVRPSIIATEQQEEDKDIKQEEIETRNKSPSQLLTTVLSLEQQKANSQKIIGDFRETEQEKIANLFAYLSKNPINIQFKLS